MLYMIETTDDYNPFHGSKIHPEWGIFQSKKDIENWISQNRNKYCDGYNYKAVPIAFHN